MDASERHGASDSPEALAAGIMDDFAERTGLSSANPPVRYLWTDAFAVCNYLTLFRRTGAQRYSELAVRLIEEVQHVLGRHRPDDSRHGWISGLDEAEGERHPTAGGLRIGKRLNERGPADPYNPALEWDRDGQYYHYLVRWIHALSRAGAVLADDRYWTWAVELAEAAYSGFVYTPAHGRPGRLRWKMSIDLTRALVPSEGAHDPLDGFVTSAALRATLPARLMPQPALERHIEGLWEMCQGRGWVTDDPLGAGGLLMDACWGTALTGSDAVSPDALRTLSARLWRDSLASLAALTRGYPFGQPPAERLAFRELGLAIGLLAVEALRARTAPTDPNRAVIDDVTRFMPLARAVLDTWLDADARRGRSWTAHEDINAVMLATALAPDEYLRL